MPVKNNKKKNKKQSGGNVGSAAVGLITNMIGLGKQIFKTSAGIMRMPADLARASPPPPKEAQTDNTPPQDMPNKDLDNVPKNIQ